LFACCLATNQPHLGCAINYNRLLEIQKQGPTLQHKQKLVKTTHPCRD